MADILSQEEIDRLLNATAAEPAPEVSDLTPGEVEAVEKLVKVFFASANAALSSLLARAAAVEEGLGQVARIRDLDTGKTFVAKFPFRSGFSGAMALLVRHREASMLADLILGGQGVAKDTLEEPDLDALKEAFTQVAGSGVPTLSVTLGREVGFGPAKLEEVSQGALEEALPWGSAFLGAGSIRVDGVLETALRILLPVEVAREMAALCKEEAVFAPTPSRPPPQSLPESLPAATVRPRAAVAPEMRNIELILDIEVEVMVRLGGAQMPLREVQRLRPGSIMDLDKDTDSPVELVVNDRVIAKGELVVVGSDHFALRITEIETPTERIRKLGAA